MKTLTLATHHVWLMPRSEPPHILARGDGPKNPSGSYIGTRLPAIRQISAELRALSACVRLSLPVSVLVGSQIGSQRVLPRTWQSRRSHGVGDSHRAEIAAIDRAMRALEPSNRTQARPGTGEPAMLLSPVPPDPGERRSSDQGPDHLRVCGQPFEPV